MKTCPASGIARASWITRSGDGRRFLVRQVPVHDTVEVADRHGAFDGDRTVGILPHALHSEIVLVGNVTDDLLQNVLERDKTLNLAIFVDDESEMRLAPQERLQLIFKRGRVRHEPSLERDVLDAQGVEIAMCGR